MGSIVSFTVSSIGCFVCTSINGSEPDCEDTFNNTGRFYKEECFSGRKGRSGLFPGTECIKLKAYHGKWCIPLASSPICIITASTGYRVLVRDCTVDDGGINSESELGRESHCWLVNKVKYQGVIIDGCSLACRVNGCNAGNSDVRVKYADIIIFGVISSVIIHQLKN
ncbi:hypothetical protein LSH36_39g11006 [Paralvinella palmiformis]|uniref:Uncharacterized protein n=1 Tax=Paralvinella palmiformis TaxID=53620 RepID=A0AAD9K7P3_9ANNE|nr:hypothetical protein LSH36_39g11006 [Paralvinella palmiformis]